MNLDLNSYLQFKCLYLPRPEPDKNADILIGMDNAHLLKPIKVRPSHSQNGPYAIQTVLGWSICGSAVSPTNSDKVISHCVAIDSQITKLWEVEVADENVCSPSQQEKRILD